MAEIAELLRVELGDAEREASEAEALEGLAKSPFGAVIRRFLTERLATIRAAYAGLDPASPHIALLVTSLQVEEAATQRFMALATPNPDRVQDVVLRVTDLRARLAASETERKARVMQFVPSGVERNEDDHTGGGR